MLSKGDFTAIALYAAIVCLYWLPVILNPNGVFIGHLDGDIGTILFAGNAYIYRVPTEVLAYGLNAPFGANLTNMGTYQPVFLFVLPLISSSIGVLATYNYYIIFNVFFAAVVMYFFAKNFLELEEAAFISGLVFGFSPYMLTRAIAFHVNLLGTGWMVLFFYSLFYMEEKKTVLSGVFCGLALFLVVFTGYYNFFFALVFAAIFYLWHWNEGVREWVTALVTRT